MALRSESGPYHPLTFEQECQLARRIERGDLGAKSELIESKLPLVIFIAKRHLNSGIELADLVQEGTIGLIRAAEKFDWRRGCRFSTMCDPWISGAIRNCVYQRGTIRLSVQRAKETRKLEAIRGRLKESVMDPTLEDLAEASGFTLERIAEIEMWNLRHSSVSLDEETSWDHGGNAGHGSLASSIPDDQQEYALDDAVEEIDTERTMSAVIVALDQLPEQERIICLAFYGVDEDESTAELAIRFAISEREVLKVRDRALAALREDEGVTGAHGL